MRIAPRTPVRADRAARAGSAVRRTAASLVAALAALALVAGCTATATDDATADAGTGLFDSSTVHTIALEYDQDDYDAMIDTYLSSGDKDWITATVTIDGTVLDDVGLKLKGNSTLRGLTSASAEDDGDGGDSSDGDASADEPAGLPWRIRLDKYVDGQSYEGQTDLVVRGSSTETSLNEAVALDLIAAAGLASEQATAVRFSVNGSDEELRLVVQNPGEVFDAENFDSDGILYKALSTGDYSYRGEDPADYAEAFEVKASTSGEDDYAPLIAFLKFLDESDDATFAAGLGDYLDVDSFATYLAVQDLVANTDDIDGPGNNSYLRYDTETGLMTVVAWDQNLSFGGFGGGGGDLGGGQAPGDGQLPGGDATAGAQGGFGGGRPGDDSGGSTDRPQPPSGGVPDDTTAPDDATTLPDSAPTDGGAPTDLPDAAAGGGAGGGMGGMGGDNVLVERFLADDAFAALEEQAAADLQERLIGSGDAQTILDTWVAVLKEGASDLVDTATIDEEADAIATYFSGGTTTGTAPGGTGPDQSPDVEPTTTDDATAPTT
ncbi:MAG TPA: CotH kinase family protein [Cellulomonas sp.]